MKHDLKTWPTYYRRVFEGEKRFEIRKNDRDFRPGDTLKLMEWNPETKEFTGRELFRRAGYILDSHDGLNDGYVIIQLLDA